MGWRESGFPRDWDQGQERGGKLGLESLWPAFKNGFLILHTGPKNREREQSATPGPGMRLFNVTPNSGQWATRGPEASLGHLTITGKVHVETRWRLLTASVEPEPFPHHDQDFLQLTCGRKRHLGTMTSRALETRLGSWEPSPARSSPGLSLNRAASQARGSVCTALGPENDVNQRSLDQTWPTGLLHLLHSGRPV